MKQDNKFLGIARCLVARFREDDVPSLGAQLTYYLILAFFPFLIFVVNVIGFARLSANDLLGNFARLLPAETGNAVRHIIDEATANRSGALLSVGMFAALWAASNGVNAIIKGLNRAYDEKENRPFWKVRGLSVLSTLVLAIVILVCMLTLVFGKTIGNYLFHLLHFPAGFPPAWDILQFALPAIALFGVFLLLYRVTPNRKLAWRDVVPGTLFATFGWIVCSVLFSFYVDRFANYAKTYGSLGGIIVLLIWLYLSSVILLIGGEINATLVFRKEGKTKCETATFGITLPWMKNKTF